MFARLHMTIATHLDCFACMHFGLESGSESDGQKYEAWTWG